MTDRKETNALDAARAVRDTLGPHGDLYMRLMGFYRIGPDGLVEPEFGYRDFRDSEFRQPIQERAAAALATLAAEVLALRAEVEQLRATIGACRWLWPSDDTSSEMCADHPREIAETIDAQEGEVFSYSRGGLVETRYFAYLRADDQSDSDDDFEVDEATEEAARAKILAEVSRRAAQGDRA